MGQTRRTRPSAGPSAVAADCVRREGSTGRPGRPAAAGRPAHQSWQRLQRERRWVEGPVSLERAAPGHRATFGWCRPRAAAEWARPVQREAEGQPALRFGHMCPERRRHCRRRCRPRSRCVDSDFCCCRRHLVCCRRLDLGSRTPWRAIHEGGGGVGGAVGGALVDLGEN